MGYVPSRSLLRRNVAESGDERMSGGSGMESTGSFESMEEEVESGMNENKNTPRSCLEQQRKLHQLS